jgi:putative transcriptional regulator
MASTSLRGRLLVATAALRESTFARTVIVMLEHSESGGALGVVLNRPSDTGITEVVPAVADLVTAPPVIFEGGPVSRTTAIALGLAAPGAEPDGWAPVVLPLVSVDLDHDPALLRAGLRDLRVFAGYAGWSAGQLEDEIADGSWYVVDSLPSDPFPGTPDALRTAVLRRQGWPLAAAAHVPADPAQN